MVSHKSRLSDAAIASVNIQYLLLIVFMSKTRIAKIEDGLPDQTLRDVEAYLGKAREGSHGVTGEGSLLENAAPCKYN